MQTLVLLLLAMNVGFLHAEPPDAAPAENARSLISDADTKAVICEDWDGAIADYDQAIALDPTSAHAFCNRGYAKSEKGDQDGAIADCSQAISLNPQYAEAYANRGVAKYKKGDFDGAIADFDNATQLKPHYDYASKNRVLAVFHSKLQKGDFDGAIADCNLAIENKPDDAVAYNNRGLAKATQGDIDGSILDYDQAIKIAPRYADAYRNRATAKDKKGDHQGAFADLNKIVALDHERALIVAQNRANELDAEKAQNNGGDDSGVGSVEYSAGEYAAQKGDLESAIADFTKAIQLNPRYADAYYGRGFLKAKQGNLDQALADYDQAISINPRGNWVYYVSRSVARQQKGDAKGADADSKEAHSIETEQDSNDSIAPSSVPLPVPVRPTVSDSSGHSYWVSEADYQRLHPISLKLKADGKALDKLDAQLDAKANHVDQDKANLDNTDSQAVADFNAEVDSYNSFRAYVGEQTGDFNTRVDAFNTDLHRAGTLAK